jgi:acetyl-CoA acyltransferase
MKSAYLVTGIRTPFAKAGMDLKDIPALELGRFAAAELLARLDMPIAELGAAVDEVIVGNAGTPADAANIARVVALKAGLPNRVPAHTVHRNCASAMESIAEAALKIEAGQADVIIAGGTESMSNMPLLYNRAAVRFFEKLMRAKTLQERLKIFAQAPVQDFLKPRIAVEEGLTDPVVAMNMGHTAEILAKEFNLSRAQQDAFALASHQKAIAAQEAGRFKDEIAAFPLPPGYEKTVMVDVGPRKGQTLEALGKLKPYFDRKFGTVTVGNACPITDGAAMVCIASEEGLKKLGGVKPLAKIAGYGFAGLEPERMGLGPVYATHKVLSRTGLSLKQMGVVEINEAFAAQVLACLDAFASDRFAKEKLGAAGRVGEIDPNILNPNGGAIAIGHPVGTTGTRIVLTAALEMRRRNASHSLATLCIGGGQGGAMILEAV